MLKEYRDNLLIFALLAAMFTIMAAGERYRVAPCAASCGITTADIKTSALPPAAAISNHIATAGETQATASFDVTPDEPAVFIHPLARFAPEKTFDVMSFGLARFDSGLKTPRWVLHEIIADIADPIDERLFAGTGYRLAQCAPCADFRHNAMLQRTEMAGNWAQLESSIRNLAQDGHTVVVLTGPCWKSEGSPIVSAKVVHGTVAGTHLFKSVFVDGPDGKRLLSWLAPNRADAGAMSDWQVTTEDLEETVGWRLWPNLTKQEAEKLKARR